MKRLKMLWRLARRGAWDGVGRFSGAWLWGLTHTRCRKCGGPKKRECCPVCARCGMENLLRSLAEEPEEAAPTQQ